MATNVTAQIEKEAVAPVKSEVAGLSSTFQQDQEELLNDYDKAMISSRRIINAWKSTEVKLTEERRRTRDVEIDVQGLRDEGKLDEDETIIPVRVIDTNIQREQPPYINYLKNSRRIAIFTCISDPSIETTTLELEFTRGMTYCGWETPHFKCLDGTQTHGWDAIEVAYDSSKPFKVAHEHVGHDMLFFPVNGKDIQDASEILRAYDVTVLQLKNFVDNFGFDDKQVGMIINKVKDTEKSSENIRIYKRFKKFNGKVYVSWFCLEHGTDDWLKVPTPLFLGISNQDAQGNWVDSPVTLYPVFILPYRETEKPKIMDHKGRVYYDENKQEAQTAVYSGFVNGITRASNIYAALDGEDGSGSSLQELEDIPLVPGRIFNKPLQFWHTDYPDPMVLKSLQYFDLANSQEMNQTNFAAMNREDSRKTAKEIGVAQDQQQKLDSVQLTLFSTHIRSVMSFSWLIVQSQALQNKIKFLLVQMQQPIMDALGQAPVIDPNTGQPAVKTVWVNNSRAISQEYDIRAAGDVDVVQKQEKIMLMKQDWPVVSQTALAPKFLADLMRLEYPDVGDGYAKILEQQGGQLQQLQQLVMSMTSVISGIMKDNPEIASKLQPQEQQQLQALVQQGMQLSGGLKPNEQPS